jgi:hypothetical protein
VQHEPRIQQLSEDLQKHCLHPFQLPIGVRIDQDAFGRPLRTSQCDRCDRVGGFPWLVQAKADAQVICVDPAITHDNIELMTDAYVERLESRYIPSQCVGRRREAVRINDPLQRDHRRGVVRGGEQRGVVVAFAKRPASERTREQLGRRRTLLHAA